MDRTPPRTSAPYDLAEIVLADRDAREPTGARARSVRRQWRTQASDRRVASSSGYDATSVAILALVVLAVAVILGFAVDAIRGTDDPLPAARSTQGQSSSDAAAPDVTSTARTSPGAAVGASTQEVSLVPGVQLAVGRITAKPVRDGSGAVVINARVTDVGTKLPPSDRTVLAAIVVDGEVVTVSPLQLEPTTGAAVRSASGTALVTGRTTSCTSGTHSITVITDSTGVVPESDESDNARSTQLAWTC